MDARTLCHRRGADALLGIETGANEVAMIELAQANAVRIPLADESVHTCITSPPYLGLRNYSLPPLIWGGQENCRHEWGNKIAAKSQGGQSNFSTSGLKRDGRPEESRVRTLTENAKELRRKAPGSGSQFCRLCGCWRGQLGLEPSPAMYVQHLVQIFREIRRILRRDGTVWLVIGDSYAGAGYSNHYNTGGAIGKDGSPGRKAGKLKSKDLYMIPARVALALQADGWWLRSEITWCKRAPMPESVRDRPTSATEKIFLLSKSKTYFYDQDAVRVPAISLGRDAPGGNYIIKGWPDGNPERHKTSTLGKVAVPNPAGRNMWNYLLLGPEPYSGKHFAVFPSSIPDIAIRAGTSQRGCCPECGKAWVRVTDYRRSPIVGQAGRPKGDGQQRGYGTTTSGLSGQSGKGAAVPKVTTIGWRPACGCYSEPITCPDCRGTKYDWRAQMDAPPMTNDEWIEWYKTAPECVTCEGNGEVECNALWPDDIDRWPTKPCIVLDPFCGSGTTLLVARRLGRSAIGLDLSYSYLHDQARARLNLDKLSEWESGREPVQADWDDLPLWAATAENA